jgi:hypothetical protein
MFQTVTQGLRQRDVREEGWRGVNIEGHLLQDLFSNYRSEETQIQIPLVPSSKVSSVVLYAMTSTVLAVVQINHKAGRRSAVCWIASL